LRRNEHIRYFVAEEFNPWIAAHSSATSCGMSPLMSYSTAPVAVALRCAVAERVIQQRRRAFGRRGGRAVHECAKPSS